MRPRLCGGLWVRAVTLGSLGVHRFQKLGSVIGDGERDGGDGGDGAGRLGGTRRLLPVVIGGGSGPTKASVAVRLLFSKIASRPRTARNTQPWYPSPILRLNGGFIALVGKNADAHGITRDDAQQRKQGTVRFGRKRRRWGGGGGGTYGAATTAGGGGRRDGEKIGRSRVADSDVKGSDQSGFPGARRRGRDRFAPNCQFGSQIGSHGLRKDPRAAFVSGFWQRTQRQSFLARTPKPAQISTSRSGPPSTPCPPTTIACNKVIRLSAIGKAAPRRRCNQKLLAAGSCPALDWRARRAVPGRSRR